MKQLFGFRPYISRRLGEKGSIRHPYYSEIHRDMPYDIFKVILKLTKSMQGFCEPFCYQGSNKKADVISFTSLRLVNELLCLLSGVSEINLATYFKRTVGGRRKGHKTSVIVSDVKDFAFIYKVKQGRLIIAFHYGEWNIHGFPQHS